MDVYTDCVNGTVLSYRGRAFCVLPLNGDGRRRLVELHVAGFGKDRKERQGTAFGP